MLVLVFLSGAERSVLSSVSTAPLRSGHTTCSLPLSDAVTPPLQRRPGKMRRGSAAALAMRPARQLFGRASAAALALCRDAGVGWTGDYKDCGAKVPAVAAWPAKQEAPSSSQAKKTCKNSLRTGSECIALQRCC